MRRALTLMSLTVVIAATAAGCADDSGVSTGRSGDTFVGDGEAETTAPIVTDPSESTTTSDSTTTATAATTGVPTTPPTTAASTTAPSPTEATPPPTPAPTDPPTTAGPLTSPVSGAGTEWVRGAEEGDPEVITADTDCVAFFDAIAAGPYSVSECGTWAAQGGTRVWTVTKGSSGRFFGIVWQESDPGVWSPRLRVLEPAAGVWDDLNLVTSNIDSGANEELIAGTRLAGTGGYLTVEIIDIRSGNPRVVARVPELHHGRAQLASEGVYVYSAGFDDPECCPSAFDQFLLVSTASGWGLAEGFAGAPPDSIPASDL